MQMNSVESEIKEFELDETFSALLYSHFPDKLWNTIKEVIKLAENVQLNSLDIDVLTYITNMEIADEDVKPVVIGYIKSKLEERFKESGISIKMGASLLVFKDYLNLLDTLPNIDPDLGEELYERLLDFDKEGEMCLSEILSEYQTLSSIEYYESLRYVTNTCLSTLAEMIPKTYKESDVKLLQILVSYGLKDTIMYSIITSGEDIDKHLEFYYNFITHNITEQPKTTIAKDIVSILWIFRDKGNTMLNVYEDYILDDLNDRFTLSEVDEITKLVYDGISYIMDKGEDNG